MEKEKREKSEKPVFELRVPSISHWTKDGVTKEWEIQNLVLVSSFISLFRGVE